MSREYRLTWRATEQRWRKVYKGKTLYFPGTGGKKASYPAAWQAFLEAKARIDGEVTVSKKHQAVIEHIEALQVKLQEEYPDSQQTRDHWKALEAVKAELTSKRHLNQEQLLEVAQQRTEGLSQAYHQLPKVIRSRSQGKEVILGPVQQPTGEPPWAGAPDTLQSLLQAFLADRKRDTSLGKLSKARFDFQRIYLGRFIEFLGPESSISRLDSQGLAAYRDSVLDEQEKGRIGSTTARDRLQAVKQLTQWAYDRGLLMELPRVLSRGFTVQVAAAEPEALTKAEVSGLYSKATARQKLYLLLGLNCGFTGADISDLKLSEVDLRKGTITRKRSKTKKAKEVPTVTYKLWPETQKLLAQELADSGPLALLTDTGKPLIQQSWNTDGSLRKNDTIHSSWVRLQNASQIKKAHKLLRKTGASKLNEGNESSRFVGLYLGHSPRDIATKHYAQADQAGFHAALLWLRDQFELPEA